MSRRALATAQAPAEAGEDPAFLEAWKKVTTIIEPPQTPMSAMKPRPPTPASIPSKLTVNFVLPYKSEITNKEFCSLREIVGLYQLISCLCGGCLDWRPRLPSQNIGVDQVDMVMVPATTGLMGILPGHVSTIAELKPGVMSVHEGNDVTKYFVSSGFAFIHANSITDVVAVEAVPLDQIDQSLVQKGLAEFTAKLGSASTDLEKAEAQIGVDVHSALNAALTG
uniref:ATP synthase F1 complex delta/epsilon subunit N-terminal domain-containing protein n=1 Tax=Aegilops tauschii TaxID=37682 RepID=R7WAZ3_AEGTA